MDGSRLAQGLPWIKCGWKLRSGRIVVQICCRANVGFGGKLPIVQKRGYVFLGAENAQTNMVLV